MTMLPSDILTFWFADGPFERSEKWFEKGADFDASCAAFEDEVRAARAGRHEAWADTPRGALALIILLDQLSRNIFRGSPEAFAADPHALRIARGAIARGFDATLTAVERMFVYLPFEHAENIDAQNESVRLFEGLRDGLDAKSVDHAHRHRDVIESFGRFPHRNAVLGRVNTPAEEAYLARPGAGF